MGKLDSHLERKTQISPATTYAKGTIQNHLMLKLQNQKTSLELLSKPTAVLADFIFPLALKKPALGQRMIEATYRNRAKQRLAPLDAQKVSVDK